MTPFTLTRTDATTATATPENLRAWTYRPTAAHIREAGVPEAAVQHLATHVEYRDGETTYRLVPGPANAAPGPSPTA